MVLFVSAHLDMFVSILSGSVCRQIRLAVKTSIDSGGIRALWQGWSPMMWRDVPFSGRNVELSSPANSRILRWLGGTSGRDCR